MRKLTGLVLMAALAISSCSNDDNIIEKSPTFKIVSHNDAGLKTFDRKIEVFDIAIYAAPKVEENKLFHAANVMAQYLDNNEDGKVDDPLVWQKMKANKAFLVIWAEEKDLEITPPADRIAQDLGNDETNPDYVSTGKKGNFDGALEEILHLINSAGHSFAYPKVFGQSEGSELANAMDIARGGKFTEVPDEYPAEAWYTYDDETCEYDDCQTIEYLYWAITSLMGAQENRKAEIGEEWKLNTPELLKKDKAIYKILTNPQYNIPTVLPNGNYKGEIE